MKMLSYEQQLEQLKEVIDMEDIDSKVEYHRFSLGIKKYGYDSEFRKAYESMTSQLRHHELDDFFDKWNVPKN